MPGAGQLLQTDLTWIVATLWAICWFISSTRTPGVILGCPITGVNDLSSWNLVYKGTSS
ncbi:hypothetical protein HanPSC8_Chr17g0763891 [Helianthus annuus]|nr:hypothetical protein HanPSC8_Chr17g0763891 [Helianthus annuus]